MAGAAELSTLNPPLQRCGVAGSQPSTADIIGILHKWGIHTLGQLAALNKEELRDRLGSDAVRLWERANGTANRPLKLVQPPETFDESFEFDHEIETAEPLLFILRRFLEQLALRLSSIYLVARELTLTITFSGPKMPVRLAPNASLPRRSSEPELHSAKAGPARTYERVFKIPQPTNDIDLLFRMLQTHLENFKSEHPIVAVALSAEPIRPVSQQFGLFETALRNPHQLYETLARLTALVGNDRAGTPVLEETHRPDAFRMEAFSWRCEPHGHLTGSADAPSSSPSPPNGESPSRTGSIAKQRIVLRRFRPPANAAIFISEDPPSPRLRRASRHLHSDKVRGQIIDQVGPFLLSGNWWDEKAWARAEYDMQLENDESTTADPSFGGLVRAHESDASWKLDGIYD